LRFCPLAEQKSIWTTTTAPPQKLNHSAVCITPTTPIYTPREELGQRGGVAPSIQRWPSSRRVAAVCHLTISRPWGYLSRGYRIFSLHFLEPSDQTDLPDAVVTSGQNLADTLYCASLQLWSSCQPAQAGPNNLQSNIQTLYMSAQIPVLVEKQVSLPLL